MSLHFRTHDELPTERQDVVNMVITKDATDEEIVALMKTMHKLRQQNLTKDISFSIHGYDQDKRELWEIPEVLKLLERLASFGFFACVSLFGNCEALGYSLPGLGVAEAWMAIRGQMRLGDRNIDKQTLDRICDFWASQNPISEKYCGKF